MRRWVALVALMVAAALAWVLRDDARGVAAAPEAPRAARGRPIELVGPAAAPQQMARTELAPRIALTARTETEARHQAPEEPPPNVLDVRVFAADGSPWANGALRILAATSPILTNYQSLFSLISDPIDSVPLESRFQVFEKTTDEGVFSLYRTDAAGFARIVGVTPGQPFALLALDGMGELGGRIDEQPMTLGETRFVDLFLRRFGAPLVGTCLTEFGAPTDGVSVRVSSSVGSMSRTTDARGDFATGPLFAERVTLFAEHDEHGTAQLLDIEPAAGPVELRLRSTRTLRVRLVSERGGRPQQNRMQLFTPSESYNPVNPRDPGDPHVFWDVPRMPATLVIETPRPRRTLEVDAETESVIWTVPEVGLLEARVLRIPAPEGGLLLALHDFGDSEPSRELFTLTNSGNQLVRVQLWEGEYVLQLLHVTNPESEELEPWGAPIPVAIQGGETTHATVGS